MKTKYKVGMVLFAVLTALGLVSDIFLLFRDFSGSLLNIVILTDVIVLLLTVFYTAVGYKKPHGNLLKILMLIFSISMMPNIIKDLSRDGILTSILDMLIMICIVYVAGRLDRIEQNKYLMVFILVLFVAARITLGFYRDSSCDWIRSIGRCSHIIIWLDLCFAYFLRYSQHKEAGLADARKK